VSRWRALLRWLGAVFAVALLVAGLVVLLSGELAGPGPALGPPERRVNTVSDLGVDDAPACTGTGVQRGEPLDERPLRPASTACVVVGVTDKNGDLRWFFIGRATGEGTVAAPRPTRSGTREVLLENGAVVPIGTNVRVRCSADPNERFETWIAKGLATAAYLDGLGFLVAIDCEPSQGD
jgi:hypothetical protein